MSVVPFPEPKIWVCGCGCSTFELTSDGGVRCAHCAEWDPIDESAGWAQDIADGPDRDEDLPNPVADVQGNGSVEFAKARIQRKACSDDVSLLVAAQQDGSVSVWTSAETDEQRAWVIRRLRDAENMITQKAKP